MDRKICQERRKVEWRRRQRWWIENGIGWAETEVEVEVREIRIGWKRATSRAEKKEGQNGEYR